MALSILDGNQSATTLSTILSSGQHITAHTVVSLGTQAITDMRGAVSGSVVSISNLPSTQTIVGTVTANVVGTNTTAQIPLNMAYNDETFTNGNRLAVSIVNSQGEEYVTPLPIYGTVTIGSSLPAGTNRIGVVTIGNTVTISGVVTANAGSGFSDAVYGGMLTFVDNEGGWAVESLPPISGTVTANVSDVVGGGYSTFTDLFANETVAIRELPSISGTVTLGASTSQIGSVTASISGTVPISISSVTVGNSVTIGSLPAISGTVTANLSISSTAITSGSFTSLTSATLVPANTARKMATVYNLGAGQLFVNAGATATTLGGGFMVALSSGDFYECDYTTTTLSAIFATAGTASWVSH